MRTGRYDAAFFALIERPELAGDPRWSTPPAARANGDAAWAEAAMARLIGDPPSLSPEPHRPMLAGA